MGEVLSAVLGILAVVVGALIIAIGLALALFILTFQILLPTIPSLLLARPIFRVFYHATSYVDALATVRTRDLSGLVDFSFREGAGIATRVVEDHALFTEHHRQAVFVAGVATAVCSLLLPQLVSRSLVDENPFDHLIWYWFGDSFSLSPMIGYVVAGLSGTLVGLYQLRSDSSSLRPRLRRMIAARAEAVAALLNPRLAELQRLDGEIRDHCNVLRIGDTDADRLAVGGLLVRQGAALLTKASQSEHRLQEVVRLAAQRSQRLAAARASQERLNDAYAQTVRIVNRTGSYPLIKELELIHAGLRSDNLLQLLAEERWNDHEEVMEAVGDELAHLAAVAEGYEVESERKDDDLGDAVDEEEKACRILGVPRNASAEQIKRVYLTLSQLWHPDKHLVHDDLRIKEINWAYSRLREIRDFS